MDPDPTTHLFPDLDPLMLQNGLPPFHFDADPDGILLFTFDEDPDPAFHFDADPDLASQNDADPDPQHCFWYRIQQIANSNQVQPYSIKAYEEYEQHRDFFAPSPPVQLFLILAELCILR
jgi:hypothetical protein